MEKDRCSTQSRVKKHTIQKKAINNVLLQHVKLRDKQLCFVDFALQENSKQMEIGL